MSVKSEKREYDRALAIFIVISFLSIVTIVVWTPLD
jgi:hypothetical protein